MRRARESERGAGRRFVNARRCLLAGMAVVLLSAAALPAAAQEIITTGPKPYDRARVSGFWWRGETNGTITAPQLEALPQFDAGLDVTDDLSVSGGANGWLFAADVALARRHRVLFAFAGLSQSGSGELGDVDLGFYATDTDISLRDVRGAYEFLFLAGDWIEAGAIGGVGYFNSNVDTMVSGPLNNTLETPRVVADLSQDFNSPYPLIGGGLRFDAEDVIGIYTELTGFPSVEVGGQSGWLMNFAVDFIVSPTPEISIIAGYKRYQLSLEDGGGIGVNLVWDGFLIGGQYVF